MTVKKKEKGRIHGNGCGKALLYYHAGCRPAARRRTLSWQLDLGHLQTMVSASPTIQLHTQFHLCLYYIWYTRVDIYNI